jgi:4-amino-4-deoxy-L-arabinose transferase-like glycosyltransferase
VAVLSAFDPIMAHVATRYWLDGPLLAFTTLAVAVFLWAVRGDRPWWVVAAGVLLGYASLIKVVAFLVVPGAALLGWLLLERPTARRYLLLLLLWIGPAVLVQLPWEIWQWSVYGSPFPVWAGKPSANLIAQNRYVRYFTVVRSPWIYVMLTPLVLWTWIPSLLLGLVLVRNALARRLGLALALWIVTVVGFHVALGYTGYSKLLRYIILVVPPSVILFTLLFEAAVASFRDSRRRVLVAAAIAVAVVGLCLQIAAGIQTSYAVKRDVIEPIFGKPF